MDWYRRKSWTTTDEDEFFMKLGRARKDGRAQYLKIQAIELISTGDLSLLNVAEDLLNKVITDYPDDKFNKSSVINSLGKIYKVRKNYEKALFYFKESLDFEKIYPNVITDSYIEFSEMVIKTHSTEYFSDVEELLEKKLQFELFPIGRYKMGLILSIISKYNKNDEKERYYANIAEANANAETSGLRYHNYLGIVKERSWMEKILKGKIS